tara:strand:- start:60 stop:314 length:255 start_codon:yes stop_codon:yes gene_type:complete
MNDKIRQEINDIIEADIQLKINDYIEKNGKGFKGEELKVNIPKSEVDKIIEEYKRIKRTERSNLGQVKKMDLIDKHGRPLDGKN